MPADSIVFWMETPYGKNIQKWAGYYLGNGKYSLKYIPKQAEIVTYRFTSPVPGFPEGEGALVVTNQWPGKPGPDDYKLGPNWYSDKSSPEFYDGKIQGGRTVSKWRNEALLDWARRWSWLR